MLLEKHLEAERNVLALNALGDSVERLECQRRRGKRLALARCDDNGRIVGDNADKLNAYGVDYLVQIDDKVSLEYIGIYLIDDKALLFVSSLIELLLLY